MCLKCDSTVYINVLQRHLLLVPTDLQVLLFYGNNVVHLRLQKKNLCCDIEA
jgi:hypothetical protein